VCLVEGHQEEDLIYAVAGLSDAGVHISDDVLVPVEGGYNLDLSPAGCKIVVIVDMHPLEGISTSI